MIQLAKIKEKKKEEGTYEKTEAGDGAEGDGNGSARKRELAQMTHHHN